MLLNRVALGKHVKNLALIHALLHPVCIRLLLHLHYPLPLPKQHMLAPLQGRFQLSFLFLSFAELPLTLVHQVLLESDRI